MGFDHGEDGFCCGACRAVSIPEGDLPEVEPPHEDPSPLVFALDAAGAPMGAVLRTQTGETFALRTARVVVGRSAPAEVVLRDSVISRKQFELAFTATGVRISDLGSACGTVVNDRRVRVGHVLREGDRILVGSQVLFLRRG